MARTKEVNLETFPSGGFKENIEGPAVVVLVVSKVNEKATAFGIESVQCFVDLSILSS